MSEVASPTGLTAVEEVAGGDQTLIVSSRLMMGANTTLQLSFLFTFLYLRANNFGGMWHPSGVSAPPEVLALVSLLIPIVALLALWAVSRAIARGTANMNGLLWLALAFVVFTGAVRILMMYQFGWDLQNGTYIDISTVWYGVMLAEFIIVGLWVMSLVMGHVRGTAPITAMQARAVVEQWSYITVVSFAVYALVEFVT
ncbi:MAG TPA: hypothetical protein VMU65_03705 [Candidatus Saccharimonadales bacterium]|nr:hypothetical protein [Candidatus Saccharimonadales bacterium]